MMIKIMVTGLLLVVLLMGVCDVQAMMSKQGGVLEKLKQCANVMHKDIKALQKTLKHEIFCGHPCDMELAIYLVSISTAISRLEEGISEATKESKKFLTKWVMRVRADWLSCAQGLGQNYRNKQEDVPVDLLAKIEEFAVSDDNDGTQRSLL